MPFAVVYNKQLTDKAGITKLATNPAEWKTQLHALTHKPNQFGIWQPNSPSEVFGWWFELQNYCLMYDTLWAVGQKSLVNSPKIVAALEVWLEQYQNTMAVGATDEVATEAVRQWADRRDVERIGGGEPIQGHCAQALPVHP